MSLVPLYCKSVVTGPKFGLFSPRDEARTSFTSSERRATQFDVPPQTARAMLRTIVVALAATEAAAGSIEL